MGVPSKFTAKLADRICLELATGKSLVQICRADDMPSTTTVYAWLFKGATAEQGSALAAFPVNYGRAREYQSEHTYDELLPISDGDGTDENINRDRLRVDTRKWTLARMNRARYGDKITQEHTGDAAKPVVFEFVDPPKRRGDDE